MLGPLLAVVVVGWLAAFGVFSPTPPPSPTRANSIATDEASPIVAAAVTRLSDFNRDGFTDLVARNAAGGLWLYSGNGAGGFRYRHQMGTGWQGMTYIG